MGLTLSLPWFIDSGRCYAACVCSLPGHERCSVVFDLRFVVTFQACKLSIVSGTVGSWDLGCSGTMSVHIAKLQQVLVPYMGIWQFRPNEALTVHASQLSSREKGVLCNLFLEPVEPVCAWATLSLLVWYPLSWLLAWMYVSHSMIYRVTNWKGIYSYEYIYCSPKGGNEEMIASPGIIARKAGLLRAGSASIGPLGVISVQFFRWIGLVVDSS